MDTRDSSSRRPERVIILDADDPMIEIKGRIVWQEAHDRIVEETRRQAFQDGYTTAMQQHPSAPTYRLTVRKRRTVHWWFRAIFATGFALFIALYLLLLLQR